MRRQLFFKCSAIGDIAGMPCDSLHCRSQRQIVSRELEDSPTAIVMSDTEIEGPCNAQLLDRHQARGRLLDVAERAQAGPDDRDPEHGDKEYPGQHE